MTVASVTLLVAACSGGGGDGSITGPSDGDPVTTTTYTGEFHPVSQPGMGMVVATKAGSVAALEFGTDFSTHDAPNLEVWLVEASDADDNATVIQSSHVSLGPLHRASGAQSYDIPGNVDLTRYRSVTIWCVSAHVNFTTAPLMMK